MARTRLIRDLDWRATPGYKGHRVTPDGFDVGIQAYHELVRRKRKINWMDKRPSQYGTLNGEDYGIEGEFYVYHHWHGTHLKARQVDFEENLVADKDEFFKKIPWRKPIPMY